jgi:hypothetical protein
MIPILTFLFTDYIMNKERRLLGFIMILHEMIGELNVIFILVGIL